MNSRLTKHQQGLAVAGIGVAALAVAGLVLAGSESRSQPSPAPARFVPSAQQLQSFSVQPVMSHAFHTEIVTDGYVAAGGGKGSNNLPVLPSQAMDMAQAENDLAAAQVQYRNAAAAEDRQHKLYEAQGAALKDWQQSQADLATAASALASARNRLRLQGKSDAGNGGVFTVEDNKSVWLIANVREADTSQVAIGDMMIASLPSVPGLSLSGRISFVSSVIDPATHRLVVGARIPNPRGFLKPNMLTAVTILGGATRHALAVPRNAVIYDGDQARVWVIGPGNQPSPRNVTLGHSGNSLVEVTTGLRPGDRIATSGALFIDQAMTSN
jgi:membrane fusion protein, heavy metal efflux system